MDLWIPGGIPSATSWVRGRGFFVALLNNLRPLEPSIVIRLPGIANDNGRTRRWPIEV